MAQELKTEEENRKKQQFYEHYFEKRLRAARNGKEVDLSYYDVLLEINRKGLSEKSEKLYDDILAIFKDPNNESKRRQYLQDFPKNFSEFSEIFNPPNFGELCHGSYVFLSLLNDLINEHPGDNGRTLISLSKKAKREIEDMAPSILQDMLGNYVCNYYDFFAMEFYKLDKTEQQNIIEFICDVENFFDYSEFNCIVSKLKEKNNVELLKRFETAKEERIKMGPHKEKVKKK